MIRTSLKTIMLISDIFGRTPALEELGRVLSRGARDLEIVDPYRGRDLGFETQDQAYAHFTSHVGVDRYLEILENRLGSDPETIIPIGFSVGASVLWRASANPKMSSVSKGFCFYGSQIRQYADIQPLFDLELIFPGSEPHFDVPGLIQILSAKKRVSCTRAAGPHGFMNRLSPGFDRKCFDVYIEKLRAQTA